MNDDFEDKFLNWVDNWLSNKSEFDFGIPYYVLVNGKIKKASLTEWAVWFENGDNRRVDYTKIDEDCYVSTIFLGIDHNFLGTRRPVLFESMVFGGPEDGHQERYCSLGDAKNGHWFLVNALRAGVKPNLDIEDNFDNFKEMFDE